MASLQTVRTDDIVEVEVKGRRAHALVVDKTGRQLKIRSFDRNFTWTTVTGNQVIGHWRKTRNTRRVRTAATGEDGSD